MSKAKLRYLRISPRKVRLVANLIKGLPVLEAEKQLKFLTQKSARHILNLLNSAAANADSAKDNLKIEKILVEAGPVLKRWRARAMGRAAPIAKRASHITLVLSEIKPSHEKAKPIKQEPIKEQIVEKDKIEPKPEPVKEPEMLEELSGPARQEQSQVKKPKVLPKRPYSTDSQSKKRFFSRQTFGNVKKHFRRKSL